MRASSQESLMSCRGVGRLNEYPAVSICSASTVFVLPAALCPTRIVVVSAKSTL